MPPDLEPETGLEAGASVATGLGLEGAGGEGGAKRPQPEEVRRSSDNNPTANASSILVPANVPSRLSACGGLPNRNAQDDYTPLPRM